MSIEGPGQRFRDELRGPVIDPAALNHGSQEVHCPTDGSCLMSLRRMWGSPGKANSQWAPEVPDGLPAPRYPEHSTSCPAGEWAGSLAWQGAGQVATFPAQSCCTSAFPGLLLTLLRPAEWIRPLRGLGSIESVIPCLLSQQSGCKGPRTTSQQVVPRDFVGPQLCKFMETLLSRLLPFFSFPGWGTFLQVS